MRRPDARRRRFAKGSPDTFDVAGFTAIVPALVRSIVVARGLPRGAINVADSTYLSLREAPRCRLPKLRDLAVFLDMRAAELERRRIARWHPHGLSDAAARRRACDNGR